jgi:hypothetical protein
MQKFKNSEIQNLKRLRLLSIGFLVTINILIIGFLAYISYLVFESRNLKGSFIASVFPTLFAIQLVLAAAFSPLIFIISGRFGNAIREIRDLNADFILLYQNYITVVGRSFPAIPKFLISQKGLFIFKNFRTHLLPPDRISKIEIERVNLGRFGKKCHISFYEGNQFKTKITYDSTYTEEADFLTDHIHLINRDIIIQ